jgi:hypothetical protein
VSWNRPPARSRTRLWRLRTSIRWTGSPTEENGALVVQLDRIDAALADGRVERNGTARSLITVRDKLSGRLESWLRQFGLTPASRADWARQLAEGESLADTIRRRREEMNRERMSDLQET